MPLFRKTKWTRRGTIGLVAFTALLIYMVIPCFLWSPVFEMVIIAPSKAEDKNYQFATDHNKTKPTDFFFRNTHGDKLHAWFYENPNSDKLLLVHHGNAGNISTRYQLGDFLHDAGANVLLYDYRGYGRSSGTPTTQALLDDGEAATEFAQRRLKFAPEKIIHYGESIGSGVACNAAAKSKCGGLIFHSGLSSLPSVGRRIFGFLRPYPDVFFPVPQMQNAEQIASVHAPVLLIAAIPDSIISYHESETVYARANQPKELVLLKESNHNSTTGNDFALVDAALRKFLIQGQKDQGI
jgi:alpha-beta hydrolase superfamily lysophospholipase